MYLTLWALGAGFGGTGFVLIWVILARYGGLKKSNTFHVIFGHDSPLRQSGGASDWRRFKIALGLMGAGMIFCFSGVSSYDRSRLAECQTMCQHQGFPSGVLMPQKGGAVCSCQGSKFIPSASLPPP